MIFDIKRYAINDGPGIRTALFMKGCPLECWWCHNPEGQSTKAQLIFRSNRCKAAKTCLDACPQNAISWVGRSVTIWDLCDQCGKCADVCMAGARELIGHRMTVEQLMMEIERDIPFYDQSGGGVTFTGGEPLQQIEFLRQALQACKYQRLHTTVDTSGYTSLKNLISILPLVDLFLYDIKLMDAEKHSRYTSVSNRMILDNLQRISRDKANIIVRIPLIPGINDDDDNLNRSGAFLATLPCLEGVELMPYHEIGLAKYQGLGMTYKMENIVPPSDEDISRVEELLAGYDLRVIKHPSGRTR